MTEGTVTLAPQTTGTGSLLSSSASYVTTIRPEVASVPPGCSARAVTEEALSRLARPWSKEQESPVQHHVGSRPEGLRGLLRNHRPYSSAPICLRPAKMESARHDEGALSAERPERAAL
jgi:hypothetical protein